MNWGQRLLQRARLDRQLDKEVRFHLEEHTADLIARGHDPEEARRMARMNLGGPEQVKEECRDARGTRWIEDFWQDLQYALRTLRQKPGFAAITLLTLALGSGATTVMFTVIDGVLLRPLPFADPGRLLRVVGYSADWNVAAFGEQNVAYPDFLDIQRAMKSASLAGRVFQGGTVSGPGEPEFANSSEITANLFEVLGVKMYRGRAFLPEEDRPGATPVAIIDYAFWQRHFAGSDSALGSKVVLDEKPYTVIGITPSGFKLDFPMDLYTPVGQDPAPYLQMRRAHPVGVVARMKPGATEQHAQDEITAIARGLAEKYPDTNGKRTFRARALEPPVQSVRATLWMLLGAVSLVLLIACANVASLLLARAVSREREFAMRVALGAARGRLVRQCLTESAVLGLGGGALGMGLAAAGLHPFVVFWPGALPRAQEVRFDWTVLAFAFGVSLLSGLLFGLAPALRVPVRNLEQTLRAGVRTVGSGSRRLHSVFVVSQIAIAVVLLVSAGILGSTLLRISTLDPGVNTHNVLVSRMALSSAVLPDPARTRAAWKDAIERAGHVPGVEAVATVDTVPMRQGNNQLGWWASATLPPVAQRPLALATCVTPDYLKVMGIPLRRGRFFNDQDRAGSTPVVVIDDVMAQSAFGSADPAGRLLWIPDMAPGPVTVAGVVGHVRHWGLAGDDQAEVRAQVYYPFSQLPDGLVRRWSILMSVAVRTRVAPLSIVETLKRELRGSTGDQVLYEVRTMEQLASESLSQQRFLLVLFGIFAALALVLACTGIYGVLAYLTGRRVPEIGVRMALGASGGDVMRMVFRQSLGMIAAGAVVGVMGAFAASRLLARLVTGVRGPEPVAFAAMVAVLVGAALCASFVPARRASRVDPTMALRQE